MNIIDSTDKVYIHYGANHYDPAKVKPLKRHLTDKPSGGLWASPVDTDWGWKNWCNAEEFRECDEKNSFKFRLKPGSKVWYISTEEDISGAPLDMRYGEVLIGLIHREGPIDFLKLPKMGIDAIELSHDKDYCAMHDIFYSWDCNSIVVFNPDCVEEITS